MSDLFDELNLPPVRMIDGLTLLLTGSTQHPATRTLAGRLARTRVAPKGPVQFRVAGVLTTIIVNKDN